MRMILASVLLLVPGLAAAQPTLPVPPHLAGEIFSGAEGGVFLTDAPDLEALKGRSAYTPACFRLKGGRMVATVLHSSNGAFRSDLGKPENMERAREMTASGVCETIR